MAIKKLKKKDKIKAKRKLSRDKTPTFDISQETKNSIMGVVSIIIAVLSVLSFLGNAGSAGDLFNSVARALFGWGFFMVPFAFTLLGASFIKSISRRIYWSAIVGTTLFTLAILAIFFIFGEVDFSYRVQQGGYLGVIFGYPLMNLVGFTGAWIILIAALLVALLIALNVPIYRLINKDEEERLVDNVVVKRGGEVVDTAKEARAASSEQTKPQIMAKPAKVEMTDREFVIKHL